MRGTQPVCSHCGAYNSEDAVVCKKCGCDLTADPDFDESTDVSEKADDAEAYAQSVKASHSEPSYSSAPYDSANNQENVKARRAPEPDLDDEDDVRVRPSRHRAAAPARKPSSIDDFDDDDEDDDEPVRPVRGRAAKQVKKAPAIDDFNDDDEDDEPVRPAKSRAAKPSRKAPAIDDFDDDDENDEPVRPAKGRAAKPSRKAPAIDDFDDDEDEVPARHASAKRMNDSDEAEPATTRWQRTPVPAADNEEREPYHDEEDDDYDSESFEPTPPRRGSDGGDNKSNTLMWILLAVGLVVIVLIIAVWLFLNFSSKKSLLPEFAQINCAGKSDTETPDDSANPSSEPSPDVTDVPVVDPSDSANPTITEFTNESGQECIKVSIVVGAGETLIARFAGQDDQEYTNTESEARTFDLDVPMALYYPNAPLTESTYTTVPEFYIRDVSGNVTQVDLPTITMEFPTISLQLTSPEDTSAPVMADSNNKIAIVGIVDDHNVKVYIDDKEITVYEGGNFQEEIEFNEDADREIVIRAEKDNCVTSTATFTATKYVYVAQPMDLIISQGVQALRANADRKVTINGIVTSGAQISIASSNSNVVFGSIAYGADGTFAFDCTFAEGVFGYSIITLTATKEGYTTEVKQCMVTRSYEDRKAFVSGEKKRAGYYELPTDLSYEQLVASPEMDGGIRIRGKVIEVIEDGEYKIAKIQLTGTENIVYVLVQSLKWDPAGNIGTQYAVYCNTYGLYGDTGCPYLIGWFALKN